MPFSDPEVKRAYMKRYRKRTIENGYGKWLYQRRALRMADADYFREVLLELSKRADSAGRIAQEALVDSDLRWRSLGEAPGAAEHHRPKLASTSLIRVVAELQRQAQ